MKTSCKSLVFAFLLIIFISSANAEDNNQKISIYMHPSSLFFINFINNINIDKTIADTTDPIYLYLIYLTLEIPLNPSYSLIIQPSLLYSESSDTTYITHNKLLIEKMFRLGSGIGLRHFVKRKGKGLYLQAMSNIYYYSIKELGESTHKTDVYADLLGYLGYSWKISRLSIFSDIGIGVTSPSNDSSREAVAIGVYKIPLTFDINLGIGLSL